MNKQKEISFILDNLKKNLKSNPSIKRFNAKTNEVLEYGESFEDLADYLPFILYYDEKKVFNDELKKTISKLQNNNFIYKKANKFPLNLFSRSYDQSDLVFGLILASFENKKYIPIAEKTIESWYQRFFKKESMFILDLKPIPKGLINIKIQSLDDFGMFIEMYTLLFELTNKKKHLKKAEKIYNHLINSKEFKKNLFFPFYFTNSFSGKKLTKHIKGFSKRNNEFQLIKQNSNTIFGIIRLMKQTQDENIKKTFKEIIENFINNFYDEKLNIFYTNYNIKTKENGSDLTVFHFIELLIEAHLNLDDKKYLNIAIKIVDETLKNQNSNTGLLPFYNPKSKNSLKRFTVNKNVSWLDAEIDFLVASLRVYELTKDKKLFNKLDKLLNGIIKYHKTQFSYSSCVNIETGKITDGVYSTKMLALILKGFIAFENIGNLNNSKHKIYYTLQDR